MRPGAGFSEMFTDCVVNSAHARGFYIIVRGKGLPLERGA